MSKTSDIESHDKDEVNLETNRCYSISKLSDWLKHDTWTSHEALCLICDIEPSDSEILWPDTFREVEIETPQAQRIALLKEEPIFSLVPDPDPDGDAIRNSITFIDIRLERGWDTTSKLDMWDIIARMENRHKVKERLESCWRMFYSNPAHADLPAQHPSYFLEWSSNKQIDIPWIDWAKENCLLDRLAAPRNGGVNKNKKDAPTIDPRQETTYLNIIGGLLGIMFGKSSFDKPNSVFRTQSDVINALLEKYGSMQGIKKRTLEEKFSEAKKSISQD